VVRGSDGLLRIGGTRPHESSLWIDGFDVTDPVTSTTAIDLPNESVKGIAVVRDPIAATFNGVLGSLASIETTPGGDSFEAGIQGFIPRPRLNERYGLGVIEAFFPRAYASGRAGRMRYFGSAEFNFERVPVPGVTSRSGSPNIGTTGVTTFARLDFATSPRNTITADMLFVPSKQSNVGLSTLRPVVTAPDVNVRDLFGGIVDRFVWSDRDLLTVRAGALTHHTGITARGQGAAILDPTGWQQNWFSSIDQQGDRWSLIVSWDRTGSTEHGTHTVTLISDVRRRTMTAAIAHSPIDIKDDFGRLVRHIEFGPDAHVAAADTVGGVGLRDLWDVNARLQLDIGVRLDWADNSEASPRLGVRYALDADARTVLKASAGRFVGRVPLGARAFSQRPAWYDTAIDPATGAPIGSVTFEPIGATIELPRSDGFAFDVEHRITPRLDLQVGVRQRRGSHLPTLDVSPERGFARLVSNNTSTYRELQVSLRQQWRDDAQAFVSYVWGSAAGNSNDFGTLFTSLDTPQLEPGAQGPTLADVPHRLRAWATVGLPRRIVVSPSLEWRTGFPYSLQSIDRHRLGAPNSERFPQYFSMDVTAFKTFEIWERSLDLGLQLFNVTGHFNPHDVIAVVGSSHLGELSNSFGVTLGGYMQVRW
jgi:hypothetical protein